VDLDPVLGLDSCPQFGKKSCSPGHQDQVETAGGESVRIGSPDTLRGAGYQSPGPVALGEVRFLLATPTQAPNLSPKVRP